MENDNNTYVTTILYNPVGTRQNWLVVFSWLFLLVIGAFVTIILNGDFSMRWLLFYISFYTLLFSRRFIYDLIKPQKIVLYDNCLVVYLRGFDIKRNWTINYNSLLVTCIGYKKQKKKRRVVIGDTTNYWHSCSLDSPAGWNDDLQEEVLEQLRKVGITQVRYKS